MNISLDSRFSSIVPRVEFLDVQDQYSYNDDLICKYCLSDYEVEEGDRIAIFKLGWQFIKDYILFEWAPKETGSNFVIFNKRCLPRNTTEIYQFCFISGENNVHGASEPFQFADKAKTYQSLFMSSSYKHVNSIPDDYKSLSNPSPSSLNNIPDIIERDREILHLKEENAFLRNTLKILVTRQTNKKYDIDIQELKKVTSELQLTMINQQNQIKDLQLKLTADTKIHNKTDNFENLRKQMRNDLNVNKQIDDFGELESLPPFPFAK